MMKISKNDTLVLKGIGILIIILHNYFHFLEPKIGENEFSYNTIHLTNFISNILSDPLNSIQYIFTYFGHYGVQFFILCSGYGLAIRYRNSDLKFKEFITKRILKIYPVFTVAIIILLVYQYVIFKFPFTNETIKDIIYRYTLIANWIPSKVFVLCGPYWFYSMIFQLYLCFPLFLAVKKRTNYGLWIIMIVVYIVILFTNNYFAAKQLSLYYNFFGNIPVFILGMILANDQFYYHKWFLFVSIGVFIGGQFTNYLWYFSQISFVLVLVPVFIRLYNKFSKSIPSKFFMFTGEISMYLFALNGFMRVPWTNLSNEAPYKIFSYIYFLIYISLVFLSAIVLRRIEQYVMVKLIKQKSDNIS